MQSVSLWRGWRQDLWHASPAYWGMQLACLFCSVAGSLLIAAVLVSGADTPFSLYGLLQQTVVATPVLLLVLHAGVRPLLRRCLHSSLSRWRLCVTVLVWLLLLAIFYSGFELALAASLPNNEWNVHNIAFSSSADPRTVQLTRPVIYAITVPD
jgi:hypothetical protein